jgi:hypothetical protein
MGVQTMSDPEQELKHESDPKKAAKDWTSHVAARHVSDCWSDFDPGIGVMVVVELIISRM